MKNQFVLLTVCESKKRNFNISSDKANCKVVSQNVCFDDAKLDCRDVPKTVCEIDSGPNNLNFDETDVSD